MNRRLVVPLLTAGMALATGVASASTSAHTLDYFRRYGLLLEVSADPRDGSDFVQTNPTRAGQLELFALNDNVRLRGITVRFSDGRSFSQPMNTIRVGERVMVDLPPNCGVIQGVQLDYGRQLVDRTPARLQIIPHDDVRVTTPYQRDQRRYSWSDGAKRPVYQTQPSYSYQPPVYRTQPSYVVRPRATTGWSGTIQGSFHF